MQLNHLSAPRAVTATRTHSVSLLEFSGEFLKCIFRPLYSD